jgi:hypothetical protein
MAPSARARRVQQRWRLAAPGLRPQVVLTCLLRAAAECERKAGGCLSRYRAYGRRTRRCGRGQVSRCPPTALGCCRSACRDHSLGPRLQPAARADPALREAGAPGIDWVGHGADVEPGSRRPSIRRRAASTRRQGHRIRAEALPCARGEVRPPEEVPRNWGSGAPRRPGATAHRPRHSHWHHADRLHAPPGAVCG